MNKELRLIAAAFVTESKMTKAAKLQMLNFIKEQASDAQIKALLMDGKIVNLDEQAEEIVNERFEIFDKKVIQKKLEEITKKIKTK
jgi:hypothetical protein